MVEGVAAWCMKCLSIVAPPPYPAFGATPFLLHLAKEHERTECTALPLTLPPGPVQVG